MSSKAEDTQPGGTRYNDVMARGATVARKVNESSNGPDHLHGGRGQQRPLDRSIVQVRLFFGSGEIHKEKACTYLSVRYYLICTT